MIPLVFISIIISCVFFARNGGCVSSRQIKKYLPQVLEYSYEYGVEPELVLAVIKVESNFKCDVISHRGAIGLMQILPSTAGYIAQKVGYSCEIDLKNPDCNVALGCAYIAYLKQKFQTETEILCAYNAGEGVVSKWLKNPEFSSDGKTLERIGYAETKNYVKQVFRQREKYKKYLTDKNYYAKQQDK